MSNAVTQTLCIKERGLASQLGLRQLDSYWMHRQK